MITTKRQVREAFDTNDIDNNSKYFNQFNWNGIIEGKNIYELNQESFADAKNVWIDDDSLISRPPLLIDKSLPDFAVPLGYKLVEELELSEFTVYVSNLSYIDVTTNDKITKYHITIDGTENTTLELKTPNYKLATIDHYIIVFNDDVGARVFDINATDKGWQRLTDLAEIPVIKSIAGPNIAEYPKNNFTNAYKVRYLWSSTEIPILPVNETANVEIILTYDEVNYKLPYADKLTEYRIIRPLNYAVTTNGIISVATRAGKQLVAVAYEDYFLMSYDGGETFSKINYPPHDKYLNIATLCENGLSFVFVSLDGVHIYWFGTAVGDVNSDGSAKHDGWEVRQLARRVNDSIVYGNLVSSTDMSTGDMVRDAFGFYKFVDADTKFAFGLLVYNPNSLSMAKHYVYYCGGGLVPASTENGVDTGYGLEDDMCRMLVDCYSRGKFIDGYDLEAHRFFREGLRNFIRFVDDSNTETTLCMMIPNFDQIDQQYPDTNAYSYVIYAMSHSVPIWRRWMPTNTHLVQGLKFGINSESVYGTFNILVEYLDRNPYIWRQIELHITMSSLEIMMSTNSNIKFPDDVPNDLQCYRYVLSGDERYGFYYIYGWYIYNENESIVNTLPYDIIDVMAYPSPILNTLIVNNYFYIQVDKTIWTNELGKNKVWLYYVYRSENDEFKDVPDLTYSDTELYMAFRNKLRITKNIVDGFDIKFNLPSTNDRSFISDIGAMVNISTTDIALFLKNQIVISSKVEDETYGYRYDYNNSRLSISIRSGDSIINTLEGKYTVVPTRRGLAFMSYQQFVASTDQTVQYISDNIRDRWTNFYDASIKIDIIQWRDYLVISNGTKDLLLLYLTDDKLSWWYWELPVKPTKLLTNQVDLRLLADTQYIFNESDRYYDFSKTLREKRINWFVKSQPLHMSAPNYYKSIRQLIFQLVETTKNKTSLVAQVKLYRKHLTVREPEIISFKVEEFRTFVKRFNYWKINELQWALCDDEDTFNPAQLKLNGISVKYEIGAEVK